MNEIWIDKIVGDNSGVELQTEFHEFLSHLTLTVYAWIFRFNAVGSKVSVVWYCTDGFLYPNVVLKLFLVWWIAWAVICLWTLSYWFSWWPPKDTERSQVLQNIRVFLYSQCERFCPFGIISCLLSWGEKKETSLHLNIKEDQRGVLYWMIQSAFGALSVMHYTSVQHLRALIKERVLRVVILWFLGKIRSELQCLVPFVTKWFVERNEEKTCSSISVWFK